LASQQLRQETEGKTTLIGFVGAPWTLAAYMVEGRHSKLCTHTKRLCLENPADAHKLLTTVAKSVANYALHQVRLIILVCLNGNDAVF
jgi:uroporphyrinogen decarboxylase